MKYKQNGGTDINAKDDNGRTKLMITSKYGKLKLVKLLIEKGANVNAQDKYGKTALMLASENNRLKNIELLVSKGADINAKDNEGKTALMLASEDNRLQIVEFLVSKGADINAKDNEGKTALMLASWNGSLEIVKNLLSKGVDVNAQNNRGETALMLASKNNRLKIVELLVSKGANVNAQDKKGDTALMIAVKSGLLHVVKLLLENGADVDTRDNNGNTALILSGLLEVVKLLLSKGADINARNNNGQTALLYKTIDDGDLEVVKYLIEKGVDINARDNDGQTALLLSIDGDLDIVELLLSKGADVNVQNVYGNTPLMIASEENLYYDEDEDEDEDEDNYDDSYNLIYIELLLSMGADINAKNINGKTALMLASEKNRLKTVEYLVSKGADVDIQDINGKTALMIASEKNYFEIEQLLDMNIFLYENINAICDASQLEEKHLTRIANNLQLGEVNKDNICEIIKRFFKEKSENKTKNISQCSNVVDLLETDLKEVDPMFFYTFTDNNVLYCGDIRQLVKLDQNPYNRTPFTKEQIDNMKKEYRKLKILIQNIDDEEEVIIETIETRINRVMSSVLHELRYPVNVMLYVNADDEKIDRFINVLLEEGVLTEREILNLNNLQELSNKKEALAILLKLKLDNDTTYILSGGHKVSPLRVALEQIYNDIFSLE